MRKQGAESRVKCPQLKGKPDTHGIDIFVMNDNMSTIFFENGALIPNCRLSCHGSRGTEIEERDHVHLRRDYSSAGSQLRTS